MADESYGVAFATDGRLATTSYDGRLRLYDAAGRLIRSVETGHARALGLAFNPVDGRLAVGFDDSPEVRALRRRDAGGAAGAGVCGIDNGNLPIVAWSADGATLFAAGPVCEGGVLSGDRLGEMAARGPRRMLPAGLDTVMSLRPLPDGGLLVASQDPWLGVLGTDGTPRWSRRRCRWMRATRGATSASRPTACVVEFGFKGARTGSTSTSAR